MKWKDICFLKTPSSWTFKFVSGSVECTFDNAASKLLKQSNRPGPEVIKLFFMLNSTVDEISIAHKN